MREFSEKNTAAREKGRAKRAATKKLVDHVLANIEDFTDELVEAAKFLVPKHGGGSRDSANSKKQLFLDMLNEKGNVHEDDLFLALKLGRVEARNIRNELVKTLPEDRIWISFDKETGIYNIVGTGAEKPINYNGYVPEEAKIPTVEAEEIDDDFDLLEDE